MKKCVSSAPVLCAGVFFLFLAFPPGLLRAQEVMLNALDLSGDAGVGSITSNTWTGAGAAASRDGVDAAVSGSSALVYNSTFGQYTATPRLTLAFPGPRTVTWWQRTAALPSGVVSEFGLVGLSGVISGAPVLLGTDGGWKQMRQELTPPFTLTWEMKLVNNNGGGVVTVVDAATVDQVTVAPLPAVSVDEALDMPVGGWTMSSPGAWQGVQSARAADGADYLWMVPVGSSSAEAWVERSFTGPVRVTWKWFRGAQNPDLRVAVDGIARAWGNGLTWQEKHVDVPAGEHTLRWIAGMSSNPSFYPTAAAVDAVTTGPIPGFAEVLGTPGRTWTAGGSPPPVADASGDGTDPTFASFTPASGQRSWLETTVTGPSLMEFTLTAPSPPDSYVMGPSSVTVTVGNLTLPISGPRVLSIPAGTHVVRFSFPVAGKLDSVSVTPVAATPAMLLGAPAMLLAEDSYLANTDLSAAPGGGLALGHGASFKVGGEAMDEPSLISVNSSGNPAAQLWLTYERKQTIAPPGTIRTMLMGGGQQPLSIYLDTTPCILTNLTRTVFPRVPVGTAFDTALPLTASSTGQVLGLGRPGWDGTDCVWLQSSAGGEAAWLETTVEVPATVKARVRGKGSALLNGVPVAFPVQFSNVEFTEASWTITGPTTIRWMTDAADRSGLFLDALTVIPDNTLDSALEHAGWTTGGAGAWTPGPDFAAAPALLPGQEAWIETFVRGAFEFEWSPGQSGDRLRLEIDGVVRADTAVHVADTVRVHVVGDVLRRYRWIASRASGASGASASPPVLFTVNTATDTYLAGQARTTILTDAVFWADSGWSTSDALWIKHKPVGGGFGVRSTASNYAAMGFYCTGPGMVSFRATVSVGIPVAPPLLHDPGEASLQCQNTPVPYGDGAHSRLVPGTGLIPVAWTAYAMDVVDTNGAISIGHVRIYDIRWIPGNVAWLTWAAARGLTGTAVDTGSDPDHDGLGSGLEYLLGTDPMAANVAPVSVTSSAGSIRLTVPKPAWPVTGSSLQPQTSTDLSTWVPAPAGALVEDTPVSMTWEIPVSGPRVFVRLAAQIPVE